MLNKCQSSFPNLILASVDKKSSPHLCSWATHYPSAPDIIALKEPGAGTTVTPKCHLLGKMLHQLHPASEPRGPWPASPVPRGVVQASLCRVWASRTVHWTQERARADRGGQLAGSPSITLGGSPDLFIPYLGTHGHRWGSSAGAQGAGAGWQGSPPGWDTAAGDSEG